MNFTDITVGHEFPVIQKKSISRVQLVKYAGASGDFNPIHTVEEAGGKAGTGVIAHGMLVMGMTGSAITSWIPREQIKNFRVRFQKMTYPGEEIHVIGKVIEMKDNDAIVTEVIAYNAAGEVKLTGTFEAVPSVN